MVRQPQSPTSSKTAAPGNGISILHHFIRPSGGVDPFFWDQVLSDSSAKRQCVGRCLLRLGAAGINSIQFVQADGPARNLKTFDVERRRNARLARCSPKLALRFKRLFHLVLAPSRTPVRHYSRLVTPLRKKTQTGTARTASTARQGCVDHTAMGSSYIRMCPGCVASFL